MDPEKKKQKKRHLRSANWTKSQPRLLKLMKKKQKELGEENFDSKVWHEITVALNKKSRRSRKVKQVKMRTKTLKGEFNDYGMFVHKPGVGWDSERKLPTAPSKRCRDEIIESNKRLSKCRTKAFPWYNLVAEVSGAEVPAGKNEPSGSTNDGMEEENVLLPGAGTEQSAWANLAGDVSSSSRKRTRDELAPVVLEEELQNNSTDAEKELPEVEITQTQNRVLNANWTQTEHPNKQLEVLVDATPSIYKEATNNFKLVAKKLVKVRSQFKLSRSDFMDMSVFVHDDLNRELFMEQEGKELLDWIKDSLDTYRKQFKAHQGMQQPANRQFFIPCYPYLPGGTPQPQPPM